MRDKLQEALDKVKNTCCIKIPDIDLQPPTEGQKFNSSDYSKIDLNMPKIKPIEIDPKNTMGYKLDQQFALQQKQLEEMQNTNMQLSKANEALLEANKMYKEDADASKIELKKCKNSNKIMLFITIFSTLIAVGSLIVNIIMIA